MNPLQQDIINTIRKHGASRTVEICEDLMPLGYGGTMSFDDFKSHITKTISKMKAEGHVIGEDRPNPGTKPVRYWALPGSSESVTHEAVTAVPPENHTEMDSDVAEVEQETPCTVLDSWPPPSPLVDFLTAEAELKPEMPESFQPKWSKEPDYEPSTVAFRKRPMSIKEAIEVFRESSFREVELLAFLDGIAAAERHHGIAE